MPTTVGRAVGAATPAGDGVELVFEDGSSRRADHIILGTGFRIDVRRYPFLGPDLLGALDQAGGYPMLGPGLESSVTGLHFLGAPAAWSYGPLMRFVAGTPFTAGTLTEHVLARPVAAKT